MPCQQNSAGRMSLPALYGFMVLLFLLDPGDQTGERIGAHADGGEEGVGIIAFRPDGGEYVLTVAILLKNRSADPAGMFVNRRLAEQVTVLPDLSGERPIADSPTEGACAEGEAPAQAEAAECGAADGTKATADGTDAP